ncbi:MAG: ThuA domain-containing protein [Chloroflexota bacterium]
MAPSHPHTLLLLGGTWHNFNAFANWLTPLLQEFGHQVDGSYHPAALTHLNDSGYDLVVLYTCLSPAQEDGSPAEVVLEDEHAVFLAEWLARGGRMLALHAATVSSATSAVFRHLVGGIFVEHPPAFSFQVCPVYGEHPITAGIQAFSVYDEFYFERTEADVQVHMLAVDRGAAYPMVWSRTEGAGRVVHIAMGHDEGVWRQPPYRQLVVQSVQWLLREV